MSGSQEKPGDFRAILLSHGPLYSRGRYPPTPPLSLRSDTNTRRFPGYSCEPRSPLFTGEVSPDTPSVASLRHQPTGDFRAILLSHDPLYSRGRNPPTPPLSLRSDANTRRFPGFSNARRRPLRDAFRQFIDVSVFYLMRLAVICPSWVRRPFWAGTDSFPGNTTAALALTPTLFTLRPWIEFALETIAE